MKILLAAFLTALMFSSGAYAHSAKKGTMPENGAELAAPPAELMIMFDKPARLTVVKMKHTHDGAEHEDRLNVPGESGASATLTPDFRGAGTYTINWRAMSEDGHPIKGTYSFTVNE